MAKIQINIPQTATTKAEEIETLRHITVALAGTGSYLESLLSPRLLDYFAENVRNDFDPDVMSTLSNCNDLRDTMAAHMNLMEGEQKRVSKEYQKRLDEANEAIKFAQSTIDMQGKRHNDLLAERSELNQIIHDLTEEKEALIVKAGRLEDEVVRLKAKLYDLMLAQQ